MDNNDKKYLNLRLLGFLIFQIKGAGIQILLESWKILVKVLLFNKTSALQSANAIKSKFLVKVFKDFACFLRAVNLGNKSFLFYL